MEKYEKLIFLSILKVNEDFGTDPHPHPDPLVRGTDPRNQILIQIHNKNVTDPEHCFLTPMCPNTVILYRWV